MSQYYVIGPRDTSIIPNIYYSKYIDINYIGTNLSKDVRKKKQKLLRKK